IAGDVGPRVEAYKQLALATALRGLEDYGAAKVALDKATGVTDPRFLVRVGLLHLAAGGIAEAATARGRIRWYASEPEPEPLVQHLDAELLVARGLAVAALELVGDGEGLRAARLRGRALFDAGKASEARDQLAAALALAPDDLESR